ncbi:uncharacterized protein LOC118420202 [Branchiostoma floridae]|uniref:Uncharacterized protein LOC118420202 n=1 Tax=Branchiostoma floridae TaxID=7739 RepID=A0A9J7LJE1_BRAFL|nr:uncharacterized protein LOC118420202 [Branchiostoma floridae]
MKVIESPSMKLFIFVVSKYCFQSNKTWIRAEWEAALKNNKQIFPIWLDDNNDGFKAFGNLVREFSYELRKVIAQRVNTQEISNSLPALSERICSLVCGDKSTQQRPAPSTDNSLAAPRQTILPGFLKGTSVDFLSTLGHSCTAETIENPTLEGLGLAITSSQDSSFSECAAHPVTRHLGQKMGQKSQQVTALEGRLEMAKHHAGIQETIVNSLHEEVTRLKKKDESLQKVLLNKTEKSNSSRQPTEISKVRSTTSTLSGAWMTSTLLRNRQIYLWLAMKTSLGLQTILKIQTYGWKTHLGNPSLKSKKLQLSLMKK